jgi:hypothetical protein
MMFPIYHLFPSTFLHSPWLNLDFPLTIFPILSLCPLMFFYLFLIMTQGNFLYCLFYQPIGVNFRLCCIWVQPYLCILNILFHTSFILVRLKSFYPNPFLKYHHFLKTFPNPASLILICSFLFLKD